MGFLPFLLSIGYCLICLLIGLLLVIATGIIKAIHYIGVLLWAVMSNVLVCMLLDFWGIDLLPEKGDEFFTHPLPGFVSLLICVVIIVATYLMRRNYALRICASFLAGSGLSTTIGIIISTVCIDIEQGESSFILAFSIIIGYLLLGLILCLKEDEYEITKFKGNIGFIFIIFMSNFPILIAVFLSIGGIILRISDAITIIIFLSLQTLLSIVEYKGICYISEQKYNKLQTVKKKNIVYYKKLLGLLNTLSSCSNLSPVHAQIVYDLQNNKDYYKNLALSNEDYTQRFIHDIDTLKEIESYYNI